MDLFDIVVDLEHKQIATSTKLYMRIRWKKLNCEEK